ncbi:MAG: four helix bundle protein [Verrucomicrobiae bacterium]|nr:four helix bundle protein [Verrucomicrobiae bacterium]
MGARDLKKRTREFALRVIRLMNALPKDRAADVIGKQLPRCGCSVGAKSHADFIAKMALVEEEADETMYWMDPHSTFRI